MLDAVSALAARIMAPVAPPAAAEAARSAAEHPLRFVRPLALPCGAGEVTVAPGLKLEMVQQRVTRAMFTPQQVRSRVLHRQRWHISLLMHTTDGYFGGVR